MEKGIVNREIVEAGGMLFIREIFEDGSYKDTQVVPKTAAEPETEPKKSSEEPKKVGCKDKIKKGAAIALAAVGGILLGKKLSSNDDEGSNCDDEDDYESIGSDSSSEDGVPE